MLMVDFLELDHDQDDASFSAYHTQVSKLGQPLITL